MKISPINISKNAILHKSNFESDKKDTQKLPNNLSFPKAYGYTNVAFCAKKEKIKNINNSQKSIINDLPIFEPYSTLIVDTMRDLASSGKSIISYNKYIDSLDIFKQNLRSFIDTDKLKQIGFERNKPIIDINLSDYAEDHENAFNNLSKDINKNIKPSTTPIIAATGVSSLLERIERPYEFIQSSIFQKYPTILFMEEGFNIMNLHDLMLVKYGLGKGEIPSNQNFDKNEVKYQLSKYAFLHNLYYDMLVFPSVSYNSFINYLHNKDVQRKLFTNGKDINIGNGVAELAMEYARAYSYTKDDYVNPNHEVRLFSNNTEAIQATIDILKKAVALKLIIEPDAKSLSMNDVASVLPDNFISIIRNYQEVKKQYYKSLLEKMTEKSVKSSQEQSNTEQKKESATSTDTVNGNFEVIHNPKTKFSDIGGMYNIKKQLKEEFIDIIKNPKVKNSHKPSGIMLSGPPGCGKTLLARAIAGEAQVPFISTAGSSFIEIYVGTGPKRVRELYAKAKEEAKNHPSRTAIVFIDEVDAVAGSRKSGGGSSEDLKTVNALLHEMDGLNNKDNDNADDIKIITIVATNHENMIDSAFKRSGRIDLKYNIEDPRYSEKAREEILKIHSKDLNFKNEKEKNKIIHNLAISTAGLSGADLAELLKKANRMSLNINRKNSYVTEHDINEAKMQVIAGIKTDIEHTNYELKQTIAHESGHAIVSMILEKVFENEKNKHKMPAKVLDFITNSARGNALGATYFKPSEENKMVSKESCLADVMMLYGGYAIETAMFDTHSSGVSQDLQSATNIIESAVSNYDFGSEKHFLSLNSNLTKSLFADEIKNDLLKFSKKGMDITKNIIRFAKPFIETYVEELIINNDFEKIITSSEFKDKFNKWLVKTNNQESFSILCKNIKNEITDFCVEDAGKKGKMGF